MESERIAVLLRKIADLLEYQGVAFKPAAYRRAAQTLEDAGAAFEKLRTKKQLMALPGIGDAIAEKILEYRRTGSIVFLDRLLAETQMGAAGLLAVDDLGSKRVRQLEQKLNIRTVSELIEAAKAGRLRSLPRMSEKMEKKILTSALRSGKRLKRFRLEDIEGDVDRLLAVLRSIKGLRKAEAAGSYRRRKETVGDVDILLSADDPEAAVGSVADVIGELESVERIVAAGKTRIAFDLKTGLRVDVRIVHPEQWGSALLYFTGDKEHNISLRRRAINEGLKLSEYGLFRDDTVIASETEEEIYEVLGLPCIEPKDRTADLPA